MRTLQTTLLILLLSALPGAKAEAQARLRVNREVQERQLIHRVEPIYPELAKTRQIRGIVTLEILIDTDGSVKAAKVISGHPLLTKAAIDAVLQWQYRPTTSNNAPAQVITEDYVVFPPAALTTPNKRLVSPGD